MARPFHSKKGGVGSPQYPWEKMASNAGKFISNDDDLSSVATMLGTVTIPAEPADLDAAGAYFVILRDPTVSSQLVFALLGDDDDSDIGGQFAVYGVHEREGVSSGKPTTQYPRDLLFKADLMAGTTVADAALGLPTPAAGKAWYWCSACTPITDETLNGVQVRGDVSGCRARVTFDHESYPILLVQATAKKGTIGTSNAQGVWGESRLF